MLFSMLASKNIFLYLLAIVYLFISKFTHEIAATTYQNENDSPPPPPSPHVCIIGAGISGATAAYFISQLHPSPRITVFERSNGVGGRIQTLHNYPCHKHPSSGSEQNSNNKRFSVETGASIIANDNLLMRHFTRILNLSKSPERFTDSEKEKSTTTSIALWNGDEFVFRLFSSSLRSAIYAISRYKLSLLRSRNFVKKLFKLYTTNLYPSASSSILNDISNWNASKTVHDLLQTELYNLSQLLFLPHTIDKLKFSEIYINEMVAAITRVNYGQDVHDMNALAGAIALAGAADNLWNVDGGNHQIVEGLLKLSGASLLLDTHVLSVNRNPNHQSSYTLSYSTSADNGEKGLSKETESEVECDAIVLAAPFELANLTLPEDIEDTMNIGRKYQKTVATFIRGYLRKDTFQNNNHDMPTEGILTIANSSDVFTSIGKQCEETEIEEEIAGINNNKKAIQPLWKVFSRKELRKENINRLFENGAVVIAEKSWMAYPKFQPPERFTPFIVDDVQKAFFYTATLESAGSAMEMCAVAAANVAALFRDRFDLKSRSSAMNVEYSKQCLGSSEQCHLNTDEKKEL